MVVAGQGQSRAEDTTRGHNSVEDRTRGRAEWRAWQEDKTEWKHGPGHEMTCQSRAGQHRSEQGTAWHGTAGAGAGANSAQDRTGTVTEQEQDRIGRLD